MSAPALGIPDYAKPFSLYVHENRGVASGVLTQPWGSTQRPVAYYSAQLDPVARAAVPCLRAVAAAATIVQKAQELVLGHKLHVKVPHAVEALLLKHNTQHFSNQRLNRYEILLLTADNLSLTRCSTLNPATLLPNPDDGEPHHDCCELIEIQEKPRTDLTDVPLLNPDYVLFTDGSASVIHGERHAGYAVVTEHWVWEAKPLRPGTSAQAAELVALRRACELTEGRTVNIYTDSRYAFSICHATGQLWKQRGFLTSSGQAIANAAEVHSLLLAIHKPSRIAVMHCPGHSQDDTIIARGNNMADVAAKTAALTVKVSQDH
uniref:RNase H type-1 domain-containing protein n=1 Tax=Pelusios castaneus TaxID=367368 RepID=A0A8C8RYR2_9SAUR